jgi:hypothetical protein
MMRLFSILFLCFSWPALAATYQEAWDACQTNLTYYKTHGHPEAYCEDNGSTRVNAWHDLS